MDKERLVAEYERYLKGVKWSRENDFPGMARVFNLKAEEVEEKLKKLEAESKNSP